MKNADIDESLLRQRTLHLSDLSKGEVKELTKAFRDDERLYTIGVMNLVATSLIVWRLPEYFIFLFMLKALILLPLRFVRFRKRNMEWYLCDFCYVVSYLTIICTIVALVRVTTGYETWLHKYNSTLIRSGFTFSTGALAMSVIMFGNSLVFHDIDQQTSVFIHVSPT